MKTIVIGIALIGIAETVLAADSTTHPCASVRDDTERLTCYDQVFGKPAEPVAATPKAQFGFTEQEVARNTGQSAGSTTPSSVRATITSLDRRRDGKFVVTLDNTQVWSQSEFNSQADVDIGDTITVRRGALGSYLLVTKAGIGTRVRRVK
jgi:hypothetical protein